MSDVTNIPFYQTGFATAARARVGRAFRPACRKGSGACRKGMSGASRQQAGIRDPVPAERRPVKPEIMTSS